MKCYSPHKKNGCHRKIDEPIFPDDMPLDDKLEILIAKYKSIRNDFSDNVFLEEIKELPSLYEAILFAAGARSPSYGKHSHQRRIKNEILQAYGENLLKYADKINQVKSFAELYNLVSTYKVNGIGPLAIYDTAIRLGTYLGNISPEAVYLHNGTKDGAEKILGKIKGSTIKKEELPMIFQDNELSCDDIETFLCIYKDKF